MKALAKAPGSALCVGGRVRGGARSARAGEGSGPVGGGTAVPQPEPRPGERILHRRDHRGRDRPPLEDPGAQGHLPYLGDAVQEPGAEPARDRRAAGRHDHSRGKRPARRRPGAHRRAAHRRRDRPASLGRDVRPPAHRHLRDPDRRGAADLRGAQGRARVRGADADPHARRRPTSPPTSCICRDGIACSRDTERDISQAIRVLRAGASNGTRTMRWRTPALPGATANSDEWAPVH